MLKVFVRQTRLLAAYEERMDKSMFAIVKTGGKQYRVASGDVIKVEKLTGNAGDTIQLDQVLAMGDDKGVKIGTPLLSGTAITAEILEQARADKIIIFKKKRRHNYRRKNGHRQHLTVLRIGDIGGAKKAAVKKDDPAVEEKKAAPKKAAAKKAPAKKAVPKAEAKKAAPKKPAAKKAPAKKAAPKKAAKK